MAGIKAVLQSKATKGLAAKNGSGAIFERRLPGAAFQRAGDRLQAVTDSYIWPSSLARLMKLLLLPEESSLQGLMQWLHSDDKWRPDSRASQEQDVASWRIASPTIMCVKTRSQPDCCCAHLPREDQF